MKTRTAIILSLTLATTLIGNAQADYGHHRGYYSPPPAQYHGHGHGRNWGVPAAVLAITGLAIGAAAYQAYQPRPAYVYSEPVRQIQAPPPEPGNWYFCNSSGSYYPYARYCPEGWQAVGPPR